MGKSRILYGRQILIEALQSLSWPSRVYVENKQAHNWVSQVLSETNQKIEIREGIPHSVKDDSHQGVAFETNHDFYLSDWPKEAPELYPFIVLCNHLQDVQNLGSITRAAAAFGAGVIVHESRRSASLTPAAIRVSAGMAFHIKFHEVSNLSNFLIKLHQQGYLRAGLDASQSDCLPIYRWNPELPLALVVGSEAEGIGHAVSKRLDYRLKIPMSEKVDSLNASQAATVAMSWVASETKT